MMRDEKRGLPSEHRGFTLIEVLVVVAIIALLAAILIPSLAKARHYSKRTICKSNLHQVGVVWHMYAQSFKGFFPKTAGDHEGVSFGNWTLITEYQRNLFERGNYGMKGGTALYCPYWIPVYGPGPQGDWYKPRVDTTPDTYYVGYTFWSFNPSVDELVENLRAEDDQRKASGSPTRWDHMTRIEPMLKNSDKWSHRRPLLFDEVPWYGMEYGNHLFAYAPHVENGGIPAGGNSVYGDGHVEWRRFTSNSPNNLSPTVDVRYMYPVLDSPGFRRYY